jgi:hypothetical protein
MKRLLALASIAFVLAAGTVAVIIVQPTPAVAGCGGAGC